MRRLLALKRRCWAQAGARSSPSRIFPRWMRNSPLRSFTQAGDVARDVREHPAIVMARIPKQARAATTRRRLIDAAIEEFAENGFDGATTRNIVKRARTNLTGLRYYFGTKVDLHRAAINHIESALAARCRASADRAQDVMRRPGVTRGQLMDAACELVDDVTAQSIADLPPAWRRFLQEVRSEQDLSRLFSALGPIYHAIALIIARTSGQVVEHHEVRVLSLLILAPCLVLPLTRERAIALLGWKDPGRPEHAQLREANRFLIQRLLAGRP